MKKFNLCIDIGNTNIKSGFFLGDKLEMTCSEIVSLKIKTVSSRFNCIISNVRKNIPDEINEIFEKAEKKVILKHNITLPIKIQYATPETLGTDRIAAAIGAKKYFPDKNCIFFLYITCCNRHRELSSPCCSA